jgi:hypothetical protein
MAKKISDILWDAANKHLWDGVKPLRHCEEEEFSCLAVDEAEGYPSRYRATYFLEDLGVNGFSATEFRKFKRGEIRQGARYLWLMFAYQVALDEGL